MKQEPDGFANVWAIWRPHMRKNDGRGLARETYAKHLAKGAEPQDIEDGVRWYLASLKERDREYIPMFSTWINRGAYEDGAVNWREMQEKQQAFAFKAEAERLQYQERLDRIAAERAARRISPPPLMISGPSEQSIPTSH
jgi:hypothetical protein